MKQNSNTGTELQLSVKKQVSKGLNLPTSLSLTRPELTLSHGTNAAVLIRLWETRFQALSFCLSQQRAIHTLWATRIDFEFNRRSCWIVRNGCPVRHETDNVFVARIILATRGQNGYKSYVWKTHSPFSLEPQKHYPVSYLNSHSWHTHFLILQYSHALTTTICYNLATQPVE